ncbi:alpha/beta fold hydrolase [Selenihalanaerobacter shriftii]|uniref:Alpha/beta hydrolase family protein n=1 Tax=Selenihalanaerobacter shriftii TaxID=142842 RepID=A0A1T4PCG6_9FIRM|nr:alpha/beta fold hydrolase [Selenihalanaerobacter shriftii]SJZ89071.1 Alpha/beta hydrolase family protein [Selenihalanaerobacter shriftii]
MKKKVVLVHGYNKNQKDMLVLKENLEELGYDGILVDLPLTFKRIKYCTSIFEKKVDQIIYNLCENEKISLVGHSTGGLVIRNFLSNIKYRDKIDRCVLIATPNQGSQLANIASKLSNTFTNVFKTLDSLHPDNVKDLGLRSLDPIEIGAIAGDKSNLILGKLLPEGNDGRVQVSSVKYEGLKDFIVVSHGHKDIHYNFKTAELVDSFLKKGKFEITL